MCIRDSIYEVNLHFSEFSVDKKLKQDMINNGYNITKRHFEEYNLSTNLHHVDTDPTSGDSS